MSLSFSPAVRSMIGGLAVGVLTLTACGSDDASSGGGDTATTEEFCTGLGEVVQIEDDSAVAGLQDLAATAPSEIASDMSDFADLFAELVALEIDESDNAEAASADQLDRYEELSGRLNTWSNENCPDLPENVFTGG